MVRVYLYVASSLNLVYTVPCKAPLPSLGAGGIAATAPQRHPVLFGHVHLKVCGGHTSDVQGDGRQVARGLQVQDHNTTHGVPSLVVHRHTRRHTRRHIFIKAHR